MFGGSARVSKFDRYLLSRLLALFGFFSLVLVAVYWVNRAVGLFDKLIGDGQTALVFLEFSLLTLPNVIRLVLPVSAFAATVYAVNRLTQESELLVMQSVGLSPFRLARPVAVFGLLVTLMMLVLMHVLVPVSRAVLATRSAEISENITARFLVDGQLLHPAVGITLFIREITLTGELRDLFLADDRAKGTRNTYTAPRALLVRGEGAPKLVMFDGMVQAYKRDDRSLSITRFGDFTYDLGGLISFGGTGRTLESLSTLQLIRADAALRTALGANEAEVLTELHGRFAQPLLAPAAAMIGFSALMLGGFSRFGLWRQIALAVLLLIGMQMIATATTSLGLRRASAWPLAYAAPLAGMVVSAAVLWLARQPRPRPRARAEALA